MIPAGIELVNVNYTRGRTTYTIVPNEEYDTYMENYAIIAWIGPKGESHEEIFQLDPIKDADREVMKNISTEYKGTDIHVVRKFTGLDI